MIYESESIKVSDVTQGVATLTFSSKHSINKLDIATIHHLDSALDKLMSEPKVDALVITSDKENFILGADITEFLGIFDKPEQELSSWLNDANLIFNKLEDLPFPTISAVSGYALGGGCECILATDYRIATPSTRIGLPETKLGIIPGFGGTVRLPRLIGADNAIEMICTGKEQRAAQCLKLGLVDAIVDEDNLQQSALSFAKDTIKNNFDWRIKRKEKKKPLSLSLIEAQMVFAASKAYVNQVAGTHYPAPISAVTSIEQGAKFARDEALEIENHKFVKLAKGDVTKALVGNFLSSQLIKSKTKKALKKTEHIEFASVVGAGIMGGGIAYQSASKGVPVLMKDISEAALEAGMNQASKLVSKQLDRGKIDSFEMAEILASITPSMHYAGIEQSDIVVEAVVENPKIKAAVLSEVEKALSTHSIIASNTSTIPITTLAKSLKRPENFCGMHFFNPVHRMPLVEVIQGEKTSSETINKVVTYAAQIGKSPIVVKDCPGFFVNRVLFPYLAGFSHLVRDGADVTFIDKVMEKSFGFPMGPAYLLDVIGIDTAHHAQDVMAKGFPKRMAKTENDIIEVLFLASRFGQKNRAGFYRYQPDKKGKPKKLTDPKLASLIKKVSTTKAKFSEQEIIDRMLTPMINEVVRCLDEAIVATPEEADMALVLGLGFPPFRGGVFRYLDTIGAANYVAQSLKYQHLGALYQVPKSLQKKAKQHSGYYDEQILGESK